MNSTSIRKYLKVLNRQRRVRTVTGVYASDGLPTRIAPSTALIVNTRPHTHPGEHWVVFYRRRGSNLIEYFDTFGRPPLQADYQQFLRRNSNCHLVYNKYRLQGFDTSVCGHYCLTYLYCRLLHDLSMNDFVQLFDISQEQQHHYTSAANDAFVLQLFNTLYKRRKTV